MDRKYRDAVLKSGHSSLYEKQSVKNMGRGIDTGISVGGAVMKWIIFTENIDKIMDGSKTQTRRIASHQGLLNDNECYKRDKHNYEILTGADGFCCSVCGWGIEPFTGKLPIKPRHYPGDIVYVKEAWNNTIFRTEIAYKADLNPSLECWFKRRPGYFKHKWRSPLHMPEEAARIFLRITDVRVERLQDISVEDVWHEGIDVGDVPDEPDPHTMIPEWDSLSEERQDEYINMWARSNYIKCLDMAKKANAAYVKLWDKRNAKRGFSWESNPWVFVYTFERVEKPMDNKPTPRHS
jgi:hypothetical protein